MQLTFDADVEAFGQRTNRASQPPLADTEDPAEHLKTEENEAEWGFTR